MADKEKYRKILETILGEKLGGTKYKEFGANLGPAVATFLKEKMVEASLTKGPYFVMGNNLARKISKMKNHEAILTAITESLMANSNLQVN